MAPKPKTPIPSFLTPGSQVEIFSDDEGFRGSFYLGTVIRRASTKTPNKYLVQYEKLFNDDEGKKPLREILDLGQLRPVAPREEKRVFKFSDEVDAYHNDGWWEGVITEDCGEGKFAVFFRSTKEQIVFGEEDLRLHREWVNGEWRPPLAAEEAVAEEQSDEVAVTEEAKPVEAMKPEKVEQREMPSETGVKSTGEEPEEIFKKGALVEVSSDEDGFKGAWFAATIVEAVGKDKYLVQYQNLRTEDDAEFLREEIDTMHIRPSPPETVVIDRFKLLEEVDALYNDGWWVGVIAKVLTYPKYRVFFKDTGEDLEFEHSDLRPHHDWLNGKWLKASLALKL